MTPEKKQEFLDRSRKHYEADILMQGTYGTSFSIPFKAFKGCSIGCHLRDITGTRDRGKWPMLVHRAIAEYYGYPVWLAMLQDTVFELVAEHDAPTWHLDLAETLYSLPDDYNWDKAYHRIAAAVGHEFTIDRDIRRMTQLHVEASRLMQPDYSQWPNKFIAFEGHTAYILNICRVDLERTAGATSPICRLFVDAHNSPGREKVAADQLARIVLTQLKGDLENAAI